MKCTAIIPLYTHHCSRGKNALAGYRALSISDATLHGGRRAAKSTTVDSSGKASITFGRILSPLPYPWFYPSSGHFFGGDVAKGRILWYTSNNISVNPGRAIARFPLARERVSYRLSFSEMNIGRTASFIITVRFNRQRGIDAHAGIFSHTHRWSCSPTILSSMCMYPRFIFYLAPRSKSREVYQACPSCNFEKCMRKK